MRNEEWAGLAATRENAIPACTVGADSISARFAAARCSAGGINPAPTGKFCVSGKSGGHDVCPGLQGRAMALPRGFAARQGGPIWNRPLHGVFTAAQGLREGHAPPLHAVRERPANGIAAATRANVGRDALIPPGPAAAGNVPGFEFQRCGGRERPPLRTRENTAATRENATPAAIANPCRGRCSHRPGCLRRRRVPRAG